MRGQPLQCEDSHYLGQSLQREDSHHCNARTVTIAMRRQSLLRTVIAMQGLGGWNYEHPPLQWGCLEVDKDTHSQLQWKGWELIISMISYCCNVKAGELAIKRTIHHCIARAGDPLIIRTPYHCNVGGWGVRGKQQSSLQCGGWRVWRRNTYHGNGRAGRLGGKRKAKVIIAMRRLADLEGKHSPWQWKGWEVDLAQAAADKGLGTGGV